MQIDCSRRESGDERRLAIAKAARGLIVEKGLEGLRTRDIAARVGINIATLHYHVPSKEALVALVAQSLKEEFRAQEMQRPRDGRSGLALLRMEFEDIVETMLEAPDRLSVMAELVERARRDPAIAQIIGPMTNHWRSILAGIFSRGIADGTLRQTIDPEAAAHIFLGTIAGWRTTQPSREEMVSVFAELERAFIAPAQEEEV